MIGSAQGDCALDGREGGAQSAEVGTIVGVAVGSGAMPGTEAKDVTAGDRGAEVGTIAGVARGCGAMPVAVRGGAQGSGMLKPRSLPEVLMFEP